MLARGDAVCMDSLKDTLNTKRRRNSLPLSHIALQLPPELLQKIFLFLVDLYVARESLHSSGRPDWIAITYVCRYWRSAALGQPELWSSITPGFSFSWSQAMVERSAPLPMRINMHIRPFFHGGHESLAASELLAASKIRSLRLSGHPADVLEVLNRLCSPSPLVSLSLWVTRMGEPVDLPEAMCHRDTPHLRRLTFETPACIRAPVWLLAGVTHFTTSASVSLHELLLPLQAMPQLQMLRVVQLLNERDDQDAPEQVPLPRVVLPRLSLLSFCDNTPRRLVIISSRIDAPPTIRRHFFWRVFLVPGWEGWGDMFTAMQAIIPTDSAPGIDDGGLRFAQVTGGHEQGSFEVWSRAGPENARANAGPFPCEDALFLFRAEWQRLRVFIPDGEGTIDELLPFFHLANLCAHLRTARIVDLAVAPETSTAIEHGTGVQDAPDVVERWQALLAALPSVKTLRLHRGSPACLSVLRALSSSAALLPHLQRVFVVQSTVRYATTSDARPGGIRIYGVDANSAMASRKLVQANVGVVLVEVVSERSGLEVVLVGCEVDEEALEELRKRARVHIGDALMYTQL
ncbi:hypothetical protein EDB85DRAFT_1992709 [Lactarius pseudohatsudake]|nr:hypothetical protein EDB85DRAFT_1992709 [Lactarius pseudohatsudake]